MAMGLTAAFEQKSDFYTCSTKKPALHTPVVSAMPRGGFRVGAGRPRLAAEEIAMSTWEERVRRVVDALQGLDEWDIVKEGICRHVKAMIGRNSRCIVERALESDGAAEEMLRKLEAREVIRLPKDDAITMLLHLKISRHQYEQLAIMMNKFSGTSTSEHMIPCYKVVGEHKRTLRPPNVRVTEVKAQVPLQDLLQHTVERMLKSKERKIAQMLEGKPEQKCIFTFCYGYDGASGQRKYKMRYKQRGNEDRDDKALFAGVLNPWALKTESGEVLWLNKFPQSSRFVRTFFLEFATETKDYIRRFNTELQEEIRNLQEIRVRAGFENHIVVSFRALLTNIDGKVFKVLSNTSSGQCPVCRAGRDDFNVVDNIGSQTFAIKGVGRDHSVQPMHAMIKFLKLLTNLSFRLPAHQAGLQERTEAWRASVREHSEVIIARCKSEWGVTIEGPGQGGSGTSLDGNTSRRCFKNPEVLARILDVNPDIVKRFKTILLCINATQYPLDADRFENFALETYRLYVEEYGWYIMSPSVHKILIHAAEIQRTLEIPMGAASESGGELFHRLRKEAKLHSTRKDSRLHHMQDLMHRCLDVSDPLISSRAEKMLKRFRVREELPSEAIGLLYTGRADDDSPNPPPPPPPPPPPHRPTLRARRQQPAVQHPPAEQNEDDLDIMEDPDEDDGLRYVDGNETDYELDLDDDMDIDE